jgi:predicted MFS family arabinose efflux permease
VVLWGLLVGVGSGMAATVLGAAVVTRWFHARRGLVMGALTASTATGQLLFLPLLARITEDHGWRWAIRLVAGAAVVMVPLALALVRERPSAMGLLPYGATEHAPPPPRRGNPVAVAFSTLGRAVRHPDFWLLAGTFFVCGASTNGLIGTHLIPACLDHGIPEVRAAGLLAVMGMFDLVGTTASGWLTDRWDSRRLLFAYYALRGLSLVFLPDALHAGEGSGLNLFSIFYGLDWIATVPPTVRLVTDAFGREDAPIVYGWVFAAHQVGAGVATLGAGLVRTALGDYRYAFVAAGTVCMGAALLALAIGRRRERAPVAVGLAR